MAETITIARPYAVAIYNLGKEKNALEDWSQMLPFAAAVAADEQILAFINNPKVDESEFERVFLSVTRDKFNEACVNLIKLLVQYGRLSILPEIVTVFEDLKFQEEGVLEAEITAAAQPSDAEFLIIVKHLEAKFDKKVEASVKVDPAIIGGIKIVVGDTVIDASVRGQLQELVYTLKG